MAETDRHAAWRDYYETTGARPPRETLVAALDGFARERRDPGFAIDLGCGNGRDTIAMLARGWRVLAIDQEPDAIRLLKDRPDLPEGGVLETRLGRFEDAALPPADLVNSGFALPLVPPPAFARLWQGIVAALKPGGRFSGQLFGINHSWHGDPSITFHRREEVEALLAPFAVELFREEETDSVTPRGRELHWHLFHIVARISGAS